MDFADVEQARKRLAGVIKPTPLLRSDTIDRLTGARVFLKPENRQKTGSFKIRGAFNRLAGLTSEQARLGVVAASAGNHGQAISYAATRSGIAATIVMPRTAAIAKIDATRNYGQQVVLAGNDYQEARAAALDLQRKTGAIFVDAYDDPWVIAGQGTIGLEVADELSPDVVVVPVGGGGLIAGIALALAHRVPKAAILAAEATGAPQLSASLARGEPASIGSSVDTIADGLATGRIGQLPFALIREHVKRVVSVNDGEIGEAVLLLLERLKLLTEGAGAAALAAVLKLCAELAGALVVVIVSGGNIDINLLDRIICHGLAKAGRLLRFTTNLHDRPGELQKLLSLISEAGANVRTIDHNRTRLNIPICSACVMVEVETRSREHVSEIRERLLGAGYEITVEGG